MRASPNWIGSYVLHPGGFGLEYAYEGFPSYGSSRPTGRLLGGQAHPNSRCSPLPHRYLTVAPLQSLQRCDGEVTVRLRRGCGGERERGLRGRVGPKTSLLAETGLIRPRLAGGMAKACLLPQVAYPSVLTTTFRNNPVWLSLIQVPFGPDVGQRDLPAEEGWTGGQEESVRRSAGLAALSGGAAPVRRSRR